MHFVAQPHAQSKPVAATEFGCATPGAGNVASYIDQIIVWDNAATAIRAAIATRTCRGSRTAAFDAVADWFGR